MFEQSNWRLVISPALPGAWNMAIDEVLLEAAGSRKSSPTLRLYAWQPACLSLGFAQPYADVDLARLQARGWEVVRRPTGGRAILHTDELTYSVTGHQDEPRLAGGVLESYQRLSRPLMSALLALGLPVETQESAAPASPQGANSIDAAVCFERPSNYEITVQGKKLVGSAQARRREGVLQHGSLPLYGDLTRITHVLQYADEAARQHAAERLLARASTVESVYGEIIPWEQAASAFSLAFASQLNLVLDAEPLTPDELRRAEILVDQKYGHPSWTERS